MKFSIITPTHEPRWLGSTWESVKAQTFPDWEWVVLANGDSPRDVADRVRRIVDGDPRVRVLSREMIGRLGVGAVKKAAFSEGRGDWLVELDHDDLLAPDALAQIADAADRNGGVGFIYSDSADFEHGAEGQGLPPTYMTNMRKPWEANGIKFYDRQFGQPRPGTYTCVRAFEPSAMALSTIFWAPNHVRCWRREVYEKLGGHDPGFGVCDDHHLLVRTYLETVMLHIPEPLYLYRVSGENTWAGKAAEIRERTHYIQDLSLYKLVLREAELKGRPVFDLGGAFGSPGKPWQRVDHPDAEEEVEVRADLTERWPWEDSSVGAFRAHDFLEHLPDKEHTMSEIHRCLAPGGWLLSRTPSTDGRGAFQDPTHVSYWNQNSFWYWTRKEQAQYIRNKTARFQSVRLLTHFPNEWAKKNDIPYVAADLIALKDGYHGPGEVLI